MTIKLDHLEKLFQEQLKDAYSAETQLLQAIPRMRDAASDENLKQAFADHLEETRGHVARIERICAELNYSPLGQRCKAMEGLIEEGSHVVKDDEAEEAVKDAALICAAQKVEHYEMALYGCLAEYARVLHKDEAATLVGQTLKEEKAADSALTAIAEGWVNAEATAGGG